MALSGGVDSAVAASILLDRGLRVLAFHLLLTGDHSSLPQAEETAKRLGLELHVADLAADFESLVIAPFVRAYAQGRTPSPCVACNPSIKFGLLWDRAALLGADYLCTGHYAGLGPAPGGKGLALHRPLDRGKDQTYFLCRLSAAQINRSLFPLAEISKDLVRRIGDDLELPRRPESQEICFLKDGDYRDFVRKSLGGKDGGPGDFVDPDGRIMGRHQGIWAYTVGQRRGLGVPGPEPYYVLKLDPARNQVVIGVREQSLTRHCSVRDIVWSVPPGETGFSALVQIRSRHRASPAVVRLSNVNSAEVTFEQPQSAVTAGQAAAFYQGDILIGGGWIE